MDGDGADPVEKRSLGNSPASTSVMRSRLVEATSRTSTGRSRVSPILRTMRSSRTRNRNGSSSGISPISSRLRTPPSASSNTPGLPSFDEPVKAPPTWPKISLPNSSRVIAPQFRATKGFVCGRSHDGRGERTAPFRPRSRLRSGRDLGSGPRHPAGDVDRERNAAHRRRSGRAPEPRRRRGCADRSRDEGPEGKTSAAPQISPSSLSGGNRQTQQRVRKCAVPAFVITVSGPSKNLSPAIDHRTPIASGPTARHVVDVSRPAEPVDDDEAVAAAVSWRIGDEASRRRVRSSRCLCASACSISRPIAATKIALWGLNIAEWPERSKTPITAPSSGSRIGAPAQVEPLMRKSVRPRERRPARRSREPCRCRSCRPTFAPPAPDRQMMSAPPAASPCPRALRPAPRHRRSGRSSRRSPPPFWRSP